LPDGRRNAYFPGSKEVRVPVNRREFVSLAAATAASLIASPGRTERGPAAALYARSVIIDGLGGPGGADTDEGAPLSPRQIEDLRSSGITAFNLTVGAVGTMPSLEAFEKIVRDVARWEGEVERHPAVLARIRSVEDLRAAKQDGRAGLVYGLQDGVSFEDDLDRLAALRQLGILVIQPTYNRRNLLGDGCMEPADAGLSKTGFEAIARLNALGILVDLSHCGRRTAADAIAASRRPVAFTHTGCAALAEHPRHRTDAELRAVADKGGVTGIYVMPYLAQGRQPTAADVIAHLEHAIRVCGEDHVSIGTDGSVSPVVVTPEFAAKFRENTRRRKELGIAAPYETDEGYLFASDLNTPRRLETLADMLLARGHSESRVEKLLGANLLRVLGEAWRTT
jgi:membrane dipeptidase